MSVCSPSFTRKGCNILIDKTLNPGCRVDKFEANPNYDINIFNIEAYKTEYKNKPTHYESIAFIF